MQNLKLKGKIVEKGLSYNRLAKLSNVTPPTIQKAVNGKNISLRTAIRIAEVLDSTVDDLFTINNNEGVS